MMQMVIHQDGEVAERVKLTLQRALGDQANCLVHDNFDVAWKSLCEADRAWSLVVLGSNVPATATTPVNPTKSTAARDFISRLRRSSACKNIPIIALAVSDDEALGELLRIWEHGEMVKYKFDELAQTAKALHFGQRPESRVELRILMHDSDSGRWDIDRKGKGSHGGVLIIPQPDFEELARDSENIPDSEEGWEVELNKVSGKLHSLIFSGGNSRLHADFFDDVKEVGGAENARIIFTLTPARQRAMVEALRSLDEKQEFWMVKSPIVRQYDSAGTTPPLFADEESRREPVNCLIVSADPRAGLVDNKKWLANCKALPFIKDEARDLEAFLKADLADRPGIGEVAWLDLANELDDPYQKLFDKLREETWHVIHFAGHGILDRKRIDSGLVLNPSLGAVLGFEDLVKELKGTRFLFVSSCRSASSEFISCAIRYTIPAVLGYRWPVDDEEASKFACSFYSNLFTRGTAAYKSLDYAFLSTRREAKDRSAKHHTWASSMLLTQKQQQQ